MFTTRNPVLYLLLICMSSFAQAQDVFVKDTLRVGVRSEPGNQVAPFHVVTTGMQLTIIEDGGDFVRVRTDNGVEGWVKSSYVSTEPPARIQLARLKEEFQALQKRVNKQKVLVQDGRKNTATLSNELAELRAVNSQLRQKLAGYEKRNVQPSFGYIWKALLVIIICIVGFSIGVSWHRNQAMKRLGGLRV